MNESLRTPPHNTDAEKALLGALLIDHERILELAETIGPEDFYDQRHGLLFETMQSLAERNTTVDLIVLSEALRNADRLQEVGGMEYLLELSAAVASSAHCAYHARIVAETAVLRSLIGEATSIITEAFATRPDGESVQQLVDESEHRIFSIAQKRDNEDSASIGDILQETFKRIDSAQGPTGLSTGYYDLDSKIYGFNAGEMVVLAARPGMGKTAFALNLMERVALREHAWLGRPASLLFFSLEMGRLELAGRLLCARANVENSRIKERRLSSEERSALVAAADELSQARIHIDDTPGLSILALRSRARRFQHKFGLDMVVVDYLQLVSHPKSESRQLEISYISRALKGLARELKIPVIALSQLNRGLEARSGDDRRPRLSDLRESGSIEQDADMVIMLHRPEEYEKEPSEELRGLAELVIAKHRNGPTGVVKLQFFKSTMRFENRSPGALEPITQ